MSAIEFHFSNALTWDYRLVVMSVLIAMMAAYIAIDFIVRLKEAEGRERRLWLYSGASVMGLGMWLTHFVGMLALEMPEVITYDLFLTGLSLVCAVTAAGIAFYIVNQKVMGIGQLMFGSLFMGLSAVSMHYLGMASMRMPMAIYYNPAMVALSVLIAITVSAFALWLAFHRPRFWPVQKAASAVVMGTGMAAMHYTGMYAAHFVPFHKAAATTGVVNVPFLTFMVLTSVGLLGIMQILINSHLNSKYQHALDTLKDQETRNRQLVDSNLLGLLYWNLDGDITDANDCFLRMVGYSRQEMQQGLLRWRDITPKEFYESDNEMIRRMLRGEVVTDYVKQYIHKDGHRIDILVGLEFLPGSRNDAICFILDISSQMRAERDCQRFEEEMIRAKEEAEKANKKKDKFLANMSHELRTPLNAVIGYSEMMMKGLSGPLTEKQSRYVHYIASSGHHLLDLVNDILDISKIEAGKLTIQPETVVLNPLIDELRGVVNELCAQKSVHLVFDIEPNLFDVQADPVRLKQILLNLISNAIKFNKNGGMVTVHLYNSQDSVTFEIEDTGIGIPPEKMPQLFSEFFQVDDSMSRPSDGTGLGLALTKKLVEMQGGSISAKSTVNIGSTFIFTLPSQPMATEQSLYSPTLYSKR